MPRFFYSLLLFLALPLLLLRLLTRSIRSPAYLRRWSERFGLATVPAGYDRNRGCLWVHAVSVGETLAAAPLVRHWLKTRPQDQILVTTMTPTGSARVHELFGEKVLHQYLPYDYPGAMRRLINRFNPRLLLVMETELWPNLVHQCHKQGVRTMLVNARLSEKSARGYRLLGSLSRHMLQSIDIIAAQSAPDAERLLSLGARRDSVQVTGSLKFDMEVPDLTGMATSPVFRSVESSARPVWTAASTREGEEAKLLPAFQTCLARFPELLLVLVPRHPERFNSVLGLCEAAGLKTQRRSANAPVHSDTRVLLGDSMGEMWSYLRLADVVFIGGSLVNTGCHNVLEPAALGIPVLVGPSQYNFATICQQLQSAGALKTVADEAALAEQLLQLLANPEWRRAMGSAGKYVVAQNRGSLQRQLALAEGLLAGGNP